MAVNEPALSFQFDSSQSLYEQLTKAQQANSSSFSAHASTAYHSASPMMRNPDSMPPPQLPPSMPVVHEETHDQGIYNSVGLTSVTATMGPGGVKAEQDYGQIQYDRNGLPLSRMHQRHTSMPTYMEYSPAPSFVSSHYDDYGHRGISFEPITPPQHSVQLGAEPAYIANEDTGLYTAIPDIGATAAFNAMMQLPPSNFAAPQYTTASRTFPSPNVYSVIEGSPTYKQRRRRSSIPPGITNAIAAANGTAHSNPHAAHRPSDLHHSMTVTEGDESNHDSPPGLSHSYKTDDGQKTHSHENSRLGTPLPTLDENHVDDSLSLMASQTEMPMLTNGESLESSGSANGRSNAPGPVRRARSATMMELGPYPQKSHSCPIPSCGRLFKRLEHLKRYVD